MTIPAKRFSFLDEETNVAIAEFASDTTSSVYNSVKNVTSESNSNLDKLISSATQKTGDLGATASSTDSFDDVSRMSKDAASAIGDLSKMPQAALDDFLSQISGKNPATAKSLKSILSKCKNSGMGYGSPGKRYDASINCGSGKLKVSGSSGTSNCDASSYSDLLNKLTNGSYGSVFSDANTALKSLMALAGYGYNLGMCGVFSALSSTLGLGNDALSKASGALMSIFGKAGNTNAWLDLASSSSGLLPTSYSPSAVNDLFVNFSIPSNVKEYDWTNLASRTGAGLELVDSSWNLSSADGTLSIAEVGDGTTDLSNIFNAKLTDRAYGSDDLDEVPSSDDDFSWGSYAMA